MSRSATDKMPSSVLAVCSTSPCAFMHSARSDDVPQSNAIKCEARCISAKVSQKAVELVLRERHARSEEHTSELQSLMRISYAVFCLKKKKQTTNKHTP